MKKNFLLLGLALLVTGASAAPSAFEDAMQTARKAFEAKDYPTTRTLLGIAEKIANTPAEKVRILLDVADTYKGEQNTAKAREAWQQVLDTSGATKEQKWGSQVSIGQTYLDEKRYPEARDVLSKIVADPTAPANLSEGMAVSIAGSYGAEGKPDIAAAEFAKIAANSKVTPIVRVFAQTRVAEQSFSSKHWEQARAQFKTASQLTQLDVLNLAELRNRIEQTYWEQGDISTAKTVNNDFKNRLMQDATALMAQKKYFGARHVYQAILLTSKEHEDPALGASVRYQIAQTYLGEGNYDQTRKQIQEIQDFIAGFKDKQNQLAPAAASGLQLVNQASYLTIAGSYYRQGDKEHAAQEYQKVLQMPGLNPQVRAEAEKYLALSKA